MDAPDFLNLISTVPENWISFVGANVPRAQRRHRVEAVTPRTTLLRAWLDQPTPTPCLVPGEEVPRESVLITKSISAHALGRWANARLAWRAIERDGERLEQSPFNRIEEFEAALQLFGQRSVSIQCLLHISTSFRVTSSRTLRTTCVSKERKMEIYERSRQRNHTPPSERGNR
jgi:hypothetical protein